MPLASAVRPTERPEVGHHAVLPEEGVDSPEPVRLVAHDLATVVNAAATLYAPPSVPRSVMTPSSQRKACTPAPRVSLAHDLAAVVDAEGDAVDPAERPEVGHHAVLPEEGVLAARRGAARAHDLAAVVDAEASL